ncbi:hypothetical protein KGP36_02620 [Patescibacteria group bacterium]|nr:hypothetical protein [Patescibacteria group bacterium]
MIQNDSRFCELINIPPTDSRFYSFLNESTYRLLKRGRYWGTTGRFTIAANSQIVALPPQVDTPEKVAISRQVTPLHDAIYEFLEYGWATRDSTLPNGSGVWEVLAQGNSPIMVDIPSPGGVLTLKCDQSTDVGKNVLVLGWDTATPPNWIRTTQGGVVADGEVVALSQGAGTNTVNSFSKVTAVQPPTNADMSSALDGQWWIYFGGITGTLLSNYQYWETSPSYQRYLIPFINSTITTVELIGKLAFIPCRKITDYPVIQNIAALKLGARAIKAEEESDWVTASILWDGGVDPKTKIRIRGAVGELDYELDHYLGAGREIGMNFTGSGYSTDLAVEPMV